MGGAIQRIKELDLPPRVRIIFYIPLASRDIPGVFPVNKLRNIAIVNVVTTHFLVLDMDMWPSRSDSSDASLLDNLYKELTRLPLTMLDSKKAAVIVPAFFLQREEILDNCSSILSCAELWQRAKGVRRRSNRAFPRNKTELVECLRKGKCFSKKQKALTHVAVVGGVEGRCT